MTFVEDCFEQLDQESVSQLGALFHQQDPELAAWLCNDQPPPASLTLIVKKIRAHKNLRPHI